MENKHDLRGFHTLSETGSEFAPPHFGQFTYSVKDGGKWVVHITTAYNIRYAAYYMLYGL